MSDDDVDHELLDLMRKHWGGGAKHEGPPETKVLENAQFIYDNSMDVALDMRSTKVAAQLVLKEMEKREYSTKTWSEHELHPKSKDENTVNFIFTMDLLNFSFWSEKSDEERFAVVYKGKRWTGYWSLVAILQRALEQDIPITSPDFWVDEERCSDEVLRTVFSSGTDEEIPLLEQRIRCLREAGQILEEAFDSSVVTLIEDANNSAAALVNLLAEKFNCFRDEGRFENKKVRFLKRAQIFVADLWAAFDGEGYGEFNDIDKITIFADYRIPQMLHSLGIMWYCPPLENRIRRQEMIDSGHTWEMQLRGCSIWAAELLHREIKKLKPDVKINAILLDFFLYDLAKEKEKAEAEVIPHHRTRSIWWFVLVKFPQQRKPAQGPKMAKKGKWSRPLRQMRHHLTAKIFGQPGPFGWHLKRILSQKQFRVGLSGRNKEQNPIERISIPNFFDRKDQVHLALAAQQLQWYASPPIIYHDLLLAAAKVGRVEDRIKYTFRDKMTCIEALKITSSVTPLYFKGVVQKVDKNNRLALLGDRALSLALCDIWFHTGNSTGEYGIMFQTTETRAALYAKAHELGIHKEVLLYENPTPTNDQVAETFEAIIGAIYLDCGNNIDVIKRVIAGIDLDTHRFLTAQVESQNLQEQKELLALRAAEQGVRRREATAALARQTLELRNQTKKTGSLIKDKLQETTTTSPVKTRPTAANYLNATSSRTTPADATLTEVTLTSATPGKQQDLPKSPVGDKSNAKDTPEPDKPAKHPTSTVEVGLKIVENPRDDDLDTVAILKGDWKPADMKSWTKIASGVKKHAWIVAIDQTKSLKRKGRPADIRALYNAKLRKELNLAARRVQREERRAEERAAHEAGAKQGSDTQVKVPKAKVIEEEKPLNDTATSSQPDQELPEVSGNSQKPQKGPPVNSTSPTTPPGNTEAAKAAPSLTQDTADLPGKQEPTSSSKSSRRKSKKDKQEHPRTVEELERDILESRVDAWRITETVQKVKSFSSGTRHVFQRVEETTEDAIPSSQKPSSEVLLKEEFQPKSRSQKELRDTENQAESVDKPEIYDSEGNRMLAPNTQGKDDKDITNSGEAYRTQYEAAPEIKPDSSSQPETKSNEKAATSSPEARVESKLEQKAEAKSWYTRYF
ncbi:hypothetical protein DDE82_003019 [Stemphylium lycopersici]|nr:hypothetical protein DDE82_003019 [Stemphylium lycopersici]